MENNLFIWTCIGLGVIGLLSELTGSRWMKWILRAGVGSVGLIVMNGLIPQYMIAVNLYTVGFSTLLGVPGVMTLYVLRMLI